MDAVVVGAGPVGLRVAERLASEGVSVSVLEQRRGIPRKVCSGLLSARTVRRYRLGEVAENVVHGARIHAGQTTIFVERRSVANVFDRLALDSLLLERAESSGAEIIFGRRFEGLHACNAGVIVGADGFASTVRSSLGISPPDYVMGAIGAVRGEFDEYVDIYLDPHLAPGFFAWIIPRSENVAEVGLGVSVEHSSEVLLRLRLLARRFGFSNLNVLGARPIPVDFPAWRVVYGNVALVGDAAVHTKATTGGGISYGLLAADALADAVVSGDLDSYQRFHRLHIYPHLLLHAIVRKYLNSVCPERLLQLAKGEGLEEKLSRRGDMDDPTFLFSPDLFPFIFRSVSLLI